MKYVTTDLDDDGNSDEVDDIMRTYLDRNSLNPLSSALSNVGTSFDEYDEHEFESISFLPKNLALLSTECMRNISRKKS